MNLAGPRHAGFAHGSALHAGHTAGDADHQPGRHDSAAFIALGDEGLEHLLGGIEIRDHTIT